MTSEIRTNTITSRAGLSTVTFTDSGPMFSGITTFVDNSGFNLGTGSSIFTPASNTLTFGTNSNERIRITSSGQFGFGTNSPFQYGIATFNSINGIVLEGSSQSRLLFRHTGGGSNLKLMDIQASSHVMRFRHLDDNTTATIRFIINADGHVVPGDDSNYDLGLTGTRWRNVYADTLYGDGSNLTGISAGTSLSGSTNNTVCTVTGANAIQGESTLTYDGNTLKFGGGSAPSSTTYYNDIVIDNSDTSSGAAGGAGISLYSGNSSWCGLIFGDSDAHQQGYIKYNHGSEYMNFAVGGTEHMIIENGGSIGITSCIHHLNDTDTNFGFPGNDAYIVRIAGNSRIYTSSSEAVWHRRDVNAGIATQTMLLNWNTSAGTGCALGFAPSGVNYNARHSSIEVVNEGNNVMHMKFKITDPSVNDHALERMRISREGNVSIGGIAPVATSTSYNSASLHIHQKVNNSGYGAQIHLTTANKGSGTAAGTQLSQYNGSLYINNQDDQYMYFYNNNNSGHRIAIRNDGAVHFGNQTSNTLYNSGSGSTWYDQKDSWQMAQSGDLGWSCWYINKIGGSDNRLIQFNNSGSSIGYINRSGSNVVYQTSSDYRLKKDDVEISDGIERVKKLRPIKFKWKETNEESEGFFAHEAQEICPYAVSGHKDEVATEDHGDRKKGDMIIQAVDYGEFTPLLSAAVKELITKVETLEQENIALRVRVTNLEGE